MSKIDLKTYEPKITCDVKSVFGNRVEVYLFDSKHIKETPMLEAWVHDNDLQALTIVSTNIGFVRAYQKSFTEKEAT